MAVYIVTYDLNAPGQNYNNLINAIKSYTHCYALKSAFFIDTHKGAAELRDELMKYVDKNDILYVMELKRHWGCNRETACTTWLQNSARTWS